MPAIVVPTINSNDTDALLVAWAKAHGDPVLAGETIATLETTKASFELAAEQSGKLHISATPGKRYDFGSTVGHIVVDPAELAELDRGAATDDGRKAEGLVLTNSARALAAKHGIRDDQLQALGKRVIKSEDLTQFLPSGASESSDATGTRSLPDQQQTIARVVARSKREIPHSFTLKRVAVDQALELLATYSREQKVMASLPDLLVWLLGRIAPDHPSFFGSLDGSLRHRHSAEGNIGVTFDVGSGLYIPVVRGAAQLSLRDIARQMMTFRMRAARNSFKAEDLAGGDISLSINSDRDVVLVVPVIMPPQTCMVSLGSVLTELVLKDGTVQPQRYVHLGVAFDHRIINGFHANAFLNSLKQGIEEPNPERWR